MLKRISLIKTDHACNLHGEIYSTEEHIDLNVFIKWASQKSLFYLLSLTVSKPLTDRKRKLEDGVTKGFGSSEPVRKQELEDSVSESVGSFDPVNLDKSCFGFCVANILGYTNLLLSETLEWANVFQKDCVASLESGNRSLIGPRFSAHLKVASFFSYNSLDEENLEMKKLYLWIITKLATKTPFLCVHQNNIKDGFSHTVLVHISR